MPRLFAFSWIRESLEQLAYAIFGESDPLALLPPFCNCGRNDEHVTLDLNGEPVACFAGSRCPCSLADRPCVAGLCRCYNEECCSFKIPLRVSQYGVRGV